MKQSALLLVLFAVTLNTVQAQKTRKEKKEERKERLNALARQDEEGVIIFNKHNVFGLGLSTDGYGILFEKGWKQDKARTSILRLEFFEKKHIKEERVTNPTFFGASNSFIYGKLNNFYQFRAGYGLVKLIGSKGNKNGIEVSAVGLGGLSVGLLKPYYYDMQDRTGNVKKRVTFDKRDTNLTRINGAAGFSYGWKELKVKPGAFAKAGLRFDYGRYNEMVGAVELGLMGEFYAAKIPQLYNNKQKQFFFSGYVSILFGKRK
jgi:hypothetical protein